MGATLWTKEEKELLRDLLAKYGRSADYYKAQLIAEFRDEYPRRSRDSVRSMLRTMRPKQYTMKLEKPKPASEAYSDNTKMIAAGFGAAFFIGVIVGILLKTAGVV